MFRKILFAAIIILVSASLWFRPDVLTITAGISLFLFGMLCLEQGFRQVSGGLVTQLLSFTSRNRLSSFSAGMVATGILQSSSMVSVIIISFVSTGMISLAAGIAMVAGTGLGSTFGTWLIAGLGLKVSISHYAMPLLVIGTFLQLQRPYRAKGGGYILLGLGFLMLGIHYIKEGMDAIGDIGLMTADTTIAASVLAGIALTILMQSSHAVLVLVMTALTAGHIDFLQALALCAGTNIGTTATTLLASIGATANGRRLALSYLVFKVAAAVLTMINLPFWENITLGLAGYLNISQTPVLVLALFHSLYNFVGAAVILPLLQPLETLLKRCFTRNEKPNDLNIPLPASKPVRATELTPAALQHPDPAIHALRVESARLYQQTIALISFGLYIDNDMLTANSRQSLAETIPPWPNWRMGKLYKLKMKGLHEDILSFCEQLETQVSPEQKADILAIRTACNNFVAAIKQLRSLHKGIRRNVQSEMPAIREHYQGLRSNIVTTLRQIQKLPADGTDNISETVGSLKRELYRQDLLTGNSLGELVADKETSPAHTTWLINDNGATHDICNRLIDGAVILLLQGQGEIIHAGLTQKPSPELCTWPQSS